MPLVKLWNYLFGRSQPTKSAEPNRDGDPRSRARDAGKRRLAKPTTPQPAAGLHPEAVKRKPAGKRGVMELVTGGPHAALCRIIKGSGVSSLLEVGVGDGTRAAAMLAALEKSSPGTEIRYIAIDLFEMADSELTLKEFHRRMRAIDVRPTLIPLPYRQGLARVAHTFGSVDLVLIADEGLDVCDPWLARVTTPKSLVLRWDGQAWRQIQRNNLGPAETSKAA